MKTDITQVKTDNTQVKTDNTQDPRQTQMPANAFRIPIQIRFNDVDMVGHVNNVIFGHYCDVARYRYMHEVMPIRQQFMTDNRILILVHTEFDFLTPSTLDDSLFVETVVEGVGERSVRILQEIKDDAGRIHVRSRSVMSTFDKSTGHSFPLPPEWVQNLL